MNRVWAKNKKGFTIVELLIVIVVIAILAAISIVAYNGIQERAENTKTTSAVSAYVKAFKQYKILHGDYPAAGAMCLGEDYEPFTGGTVPACRHQSSPIGQAGNAAGRNELKQLMGGSLPMPSKKPIVTSSNEFVGAYFYGSGYNVTLDGKPVAVIIYTYDGSECPIGPSYRSNGWPAISTSNPGPYASAGSGERCLVALPL